MSFIVPILRPLTDEEAAANCGFNWEAIVTADMLTQATANTAQVIKLMDLNAGDYVLAVGWKLKANFQDVSDAAYNSDTMSVGDGASVTTYIAAKEVNTNGTVVPSFATFTAVGPYAAAGAINAVFNSMSGKSLVNIDRGEVHFWIRLWRPSLLLGAVSPFQITTK